MSGRVQMLFKAPPGLRTCRWWVESVFYPAAPFDHFVLSEMTVYLPYIMQVNIGLRVLTRPLPPKLPEIYRTLGTDYAERVLPSIIQVYNAWHRCCFLNQLCSALSCCTVTDVLSMACCVLQETLKSVIAQYNASQLLTMREVWTAILNMELSLA